jgi:hypothetical protein
MALKVLPPLLVVFSGRWISRPTVGAEVRLGSPYGLSGQWAYIRLGQLHLIKGEVLANGITPLIA